MTSPSGPCRLAPVRPPRRDSLLLAWGEVADWRAAVELDVQPRRLEPPAPDVQLSARQRQILEFITGYIDTRGYSPSYREIGAGVGLRSVDAVRYQLAQLAERGLVELPSVAHQRRSLRLVRGGAA